MNHPETGLYAYAITRTADLDLADVRGLAGAVPRVVEHGDLGLLVSELELSELDEAMAEEEPDEDGRLATLVRAHDAVVRAAFDQVSVLPLRFGTLVTSVDAARRLLAERADEALTLLDHVAGSQEWGAKVRATQRKEPATPRVNGARPSGMEYLTRRKLAMDEARQRDERRAEVVREVEAELAATATDRLSRRGPALLDVAYLVPEPRAEEFLATAEKSADRLGEHGLRLEVSGPWPPYSFARTEFDEEVRDG